MFISHKKRKANTQGSQPAGTMMKKTPAPPRKTQASNVVEESEEEEIGGTIM
jgi:hypothetical protein